MTIEVTTTVSKETYELGQGLKKFVIAMKAALADGWQTDKDLPVVLASAMSELVPAFQGIENIPAEAKEDLASFVKGLTLSIEELAFALLKKVEV